MSPWLGILLVMALFLGSMAALHCHGQRRAMHPELLRKAFHVTMGVVSLTLPWLFDRAWPVLLLAAASTTFLLELRRSPALRQQFGGVLDGVDRRSFGEVFFPLGVAAVFLLSHGNLMLYAIPILLLTFADSAAGLI